MDSCGIWQRRHSNLMRIYALLNKGNFIENFMFKLNETKFCVTSFKRSKINLTVHQTIVNIPETKKYS